MSLFVLPYKMGSESARDLARELGCLRIKGDKRLPNNSVVINWGNQLTHPINNRRQQVTMLNPIASVAMAADKMRTFTRLMYMGVRHPEYTDNSALAQQWLNDTVVYGRSTVTSSQGRGIKILTQDDYFVHNLPLYTKGITGKEYRVHVAFDRIIDYTQKKRRSETEVNEYIRNFDNGWVFARDGVTLPPDAAIQSIKAIDALGLHFGALDVIVDATGKAYILEVNTAPGIEGTSLSKYVQAFKTKLNRG